MEKNAGRNRIRRWADDDSQQQETKRQSKPESEAESQKKSPYGRAKEQIKAAKVQIKAKIQKS